MRKVAVDGSPGNRVIVEKAISKGKLTGGESMPEELKEVKKIKKPFYKKWWFILIIAVLVIFFVVPLLGKAGKGTGKINWSELILKDRLPEPSSLKGEIIENSDERLWLSLKKVSDTQYQTYLEACLERDFTTDEEKDSYGYEAYDPEGYFLSLNHMEDELEIRLEKPMELTAISWPTGKAGSLLPSPGSSLGRFNYEYDTHFSVYVGNISREAYEEYVKTCQDAGFTVDYNKGEKYYRADNEEGYHLSLSYKGNQIMEVQIDEPDEDMEESQAEISSSDEESVITEETAPSASQESSAETAADSSASSDVGADGIRPDFKAAMDSYEAFMNDYCDFMEKYSENPSDAALIAEYADYLSKYGDLMEKFEAWEDDDLNDAELAYLLEVQSRVEARLLEAGQ